MSIRTCILQLCILAYSLQIWTISNLWKFLLPICQNITGGQQKRYSQSSPQPFKAPPVLSKLGRGKMTSQSESRLRGHPTLRRAQDNWGKKKEAGRRERLARLTHNRASSWVESRCVSWNNPCATPSRKSRKERGRSWSVIVSLDLYQDVLGLGVEHLVESFKPIILTLYHWRINAQIP